MGRSAMSKLAEADDLDSRAGRIAKKDADSARELRELARGKRKSAIKQLKRHPKRKTSSRVVL